MGNLDFAQMVLQNYGPLGLGFIFSGFLVYMIMKHFIKRDERKDTQLAAKDNQIMEMAKQFSSSLDKNTTTITANTTAMHELREAMVQVSNTNGQVLEGFKWLDKMVEKNEKEHAEILHFARGRTRV